MRLLWSKAKTQLFRTASSFLHQLLVRHAIELTGLADLTALDDQAREPSLSHCRRNRCGCLTTREGQLPCFLKLPHKRVERYGYCHLCPRSATFA